MEIISIRLPRQILEEIDKLIRRGRYPSRSELIRIAILELLRKEQLDGLVCGSRKSKPVESIIYI